MISSWRDTTIGEQVTLQRGIDITRARQQSGNVPVVSSGGISSYHDTAAVKGPGVVLGRKGVVGSVYYIDTDYWPHDTTLWVKDFHGNDPRFVYYFFKHRAAQLLSMDVGSANPTLNRNHVHPIRVRWPTTNEQLVISSILGTLDDKIELNRRMNETLEAMAQTVFKSWMVDATRDGLPEGWRESTIGEETRVVGGSTPSTKEAEFWDSGTIHWATPKDLSSLESPVLLDSERLITEAGLAQISSGLLPRGTVLLSSRAPIGYLAISEIPVAVNQGFIAMVCNKVLPNYYVRLWAQTSLDLIKANANGTTFQEISKTNFRPLPVVVPPKSTLDDFIKAIEPLHQRTVANLRESLMLAAIRDGLLPKLLSGELRIPAPASTDRP